MSVKIAAAGKHVYFSDATTFVIYGIRTIFFGPTSSFFILTFSCLFCDSFFFFLSVFLPGFLSCQFERRFSPKLSVVRRTPSWLTRPKYCTSKQNGKKRIWSHFNSWQFVAVVVAEVHETKTQTFAAPEAYMYVCMPSFLFGNSLAREMEQSVASSKYV